MPQREVFGTRDRSYSAWHRIDSIRRFVGIEKAQALGLIDLDASLYVEYDDNTKDPLILIETAMDNGQDIKPATVTARLAQRCTPTVLAYVLLYKLSDVSNPADPTCKDIVSFRAQQLHPVKEREWTTFTPKQWAAYLLVLREWASKQIDEYHKRSIPEWAQQNEPETEENHA